MRTLRAALMRLKGTFARSRHERDMAAELESHLQLHIDDNVRAGMTPVEARRLALLKFGGLEAIKEQHRDRGGYPAVSHLLQDLRFATRLLRKAPAFSVTAIVTIALAVGVNAAIFTVLNAAALQSLRTPQSRDLAAVALSLEGGTKGRGVHGMRSMLSWPEFLAVRDQTRALEGTMAFNPFNAVTLSAGEPRQMLATVASCEYFDVLRVRAALGRTFVHADCAAGAPHTVVLGHALWRSAFNEDPAIVRRTVSINRTPFTVIGVTPPWFSGTQLVAEDAFVPVPSQPSITRGRNLIDNANMSWLFVIGRLREGASMGALRGDLGVVAGRLTAAEHAGRTFRLEAERATLSGLPEIRQVVLGVGGVIVAGVTLVLLIACANIANLLLARSTARRREFAVRMALGASRRRVVQQLLTESLLLAAIGGAIGFVTAEWGTRGIVRFLLAHLPRGTWPMIFDPRPDWRVLAYVAGLTLLTGVAFGLVPALRGTRDATMDFKSTTASDGRASRRLQQVFVAVQVAVCLVLLVSAGLLARGLYRAHTIDPGLGMDSVSVVAYDLGGAGYSPAAAAAFQRRVLDRLGAIPNVRGVAAASAVPLSDQHQETGFSLDGSENLRFMEFSQVSPSYFDLLGIAIVRGRTFLPSEAESERAAIVTESTARRLWPGADPLAQTLTLDSVPRPVVGVARDAQVSRLGQHDGVYVYLPAGAPEQPTSRSSSSVTTRNFHVLVAGTPATPSPRAIAAAVRELDADLAVDVTRLADNLEQWRAPSIVVSTLAAALGLLALVLACTGVFGTVAYTVSRRVREIGIRVALGAAREDVLRLIVRQGLRPVVIGVAIGLAGAAAVSTVLGSMLFGLSPHDPASFVLAPAALFGIAVLACYVPARRALRVQPTTALRTE
jgi:putative ABC transport system permease protein